MGIFKNRIKDPYFVKPSDATIAQCFKKGDIITKLSFFIFGLGNLLNKQFARAVVFLGAEIAYIYYMFNTGIAAIGDMITLGTEEQAEVWDDALGIYTYTDGDNSMLCLLFGVIAVFLTLAIVFMACMSGKSAFATQYRKEHGMKVPSFLDDLRSVKEENLHNAFLAIPLVGVLVFTITPLIFTILIAFTNYDRNHQPPGNLFDWVGLDNFEAFLSTGGRLAGTFWPVLGWTLVWAVFATITCYVGGLILALLINRKGTKWKGFWRFMFVISIAVPQFVTLLSMKTIFADNGPVNVLLRDWGFIGANESIYFFTDVTIARVLIICINFWIGVPFTMLSTTGILQNIPAELYEAAKIDGATGLKRELYVTIPLVKPTIKTVTTLAATSGFLLYNEVYFLTNGAAGTKSISFIIRELAITSSRTQYARANTIGAIQIVIGLILVGVINIIFAESKESQRGGKA